MYVYSNLLYEAMCDAFDKQSLVIFVKLVFDKRLDHIVGDGAFNHMVFELIQWSEMNGYDSRLAQAVCQEKPDNKKVIILATALGIEQNPCNE